MARKRRYRIIWNLLFCPRFLLSLPTFIYAPRMSFFDLVTVLNLLKQYYWFSWWKLPLRSLPNTDRSSSYHQQRHPTTTYLSLSVHCKLTDSSPFVYSERSTIASTSSPFICSPIRCSFNTAKSYRITSYGSGRVVPHRVVSRLIVSFHFISFYFASFRFVSVCFVLVLFVVMSCLICGFSYSMCACVWVKWCVFVWGSPKGVAPVPIISVVFVFEFEFAVI